jgi:hypothetical protein
MAKSFKSRLLWYTQNFEKIDKETFTKLEVSAILNGLFKDFLEFYKEDKVIKFMVPEGFKGQGCLQLKQNLDFDVEAQTVVAYRDDEGNIKETVTFKEIVPKENIRKMLYILGDLEINQKYSCYNLSKKLGYESWQELWSLRNKKTTKAYFLEYYFPIKFFQYLGLIDYGQGGIITRIK